jgi:DNA-binding response OmpR family regulator
VTAAASGKRAARVLLVEDDDSTRDLLGDVLRRGGLDMVAASSAEEGLRLAPGADIILLDVGLPGMSGLEACERLKKDPVTSRIPIIMVTAFGHHGAKVRGLDTGADDYVVKPVQPSVLLARVEALLRRYGLARD